MIQHLPYSGYLLAVAIGICVTAAWSVSLLTVELSRAPRLKLGWRHAALTLSAGLGVWATHFSAMLAYRPDLLIEYDPLLTGVSAGVSIALVGIPCAVLTRPLGRSARLSLAVIAGGGIWCMHATGLAGMMACRHGYSWGTNVLGAASGVGLFAIWQMKRRWPRPRLAGTLFFSTSVCAIHFISLSGDTVLARMSTLHGSLVSPGLIAACIVFAVSATSLSCLLFASQIRSRREREERTLKAIIGSMSDGLVFVDSRGRLSHYNQRFLDLFDTPSDALSSGMTIDRFLDVVARFRRWTPQKRDMVGVALKAWSTSADSFDRECDMEDGRTYLMHGRPVPGEGVVLTFTDVTAERRAMGELTHLAHHDTLTGLGNRRALAEQTNLMMDRASAFSLLLIDLDEFKQVNDAFGHTVGDKLLLHCADRLRSMLGDTGFLARMGGDELAILVFESEDRAMRIAQTAVELLAGPVTIDGCRIVPGCSIGVATWRLGISSEDLMKQADIALYEAKRTGRRRACRYEEGLAERLTTRQEIIEGLHDAIQNGGFALAFQPVVDLADGAVSGYEALIRWHHPRRGWIPPNVFVPVAEECGLVGEIGRWVIHHACEQLATWPPHLSVAINVSAVQLGSDKVLDELAAAIALHGLGAERLEVEITETALIGNPAMAASRLERLRAMGFRVALDDFGTGQSSLSHLQEFRFDRIKIDRSFVERAISDPRSMAILRATVAIGHDLGVTTHAEGVEAVEQVDLLRSIGCDAIQGYLVGRPVIPTAANPLPTWPARALWPRCQAERDVA
ncbi:EAL domain-containing protein [Sphingomonas sp. RHCKR7]|uniref:bifunctional diguanylate cyclase/phosphodiesterase n=1 Tax=Sphingomonas folli TaxID=2862497 RepID=UPI001CA5594A|nr:EAL domain-containing protein [Sphingomonas folli]MBW6528520.1 EAL domain-containing protein [Sphingomonas folli]